MKLSRFGPFSKVALGLLLACGITTGAVAASAQPAQAGVVVSVGFGGGYAAGPGYHWHRWHDGYGWHRQWVPFGWAPPVAFAPRPIYYYGHPGYGRPYYATRYAVHYHDWHGGYARHGYYR